MPASTNTILKIDPSDNVAIVVEKEGIRGGSVYGEITCLRDIPFGHKIALSNLVKGDPVIRYGQIIGLAKNEIYAGEWVSERNLQVPPPPSLEELTWTGCRAAEDLPGLEGYTFEGYRNDDGTVGTKNILGILTTVQCVSGFANIIVDKIKGELLRDYPNVDDVVALNHSHGCGIAIEAPGAIVPIRTLHNLAKNPNFGNDVLIIGLGCEKLREAHLDLPKSQVHYMQNRSLGRFSTMVDHIMKLAKEHLQRLNQRKRVTCPAADLIVGMQCGGSDAFSGLSGNPVAGFAADLIVRAGGTVMFSEVTEVRDALHLLISRCANRSVAAKLIEQVRWYDDYLKASGVDRSANTTPGNKKGGLSNIVEKALGSVRKSGTTRIVDVLGPGERVTKNGLNFVATPASDFICGTLQMAAGMNIHVFITGRGSPYGLATLPVIKMSSNSPLSHRWHDLIDFDAGRVLTDNQSLEELGWKLFHLILEVASGHKIIASDHLGLYNELVLFNPGPIT